MLCSDEFDIFYSSERDRRISNTQKNDDDNNDDKERRIMEINLNEYDDYPMVVTPAPSTPESISTPTTVAPELERLWQGRQSSQHVDVASFEALSYYQVRMRVCMQWCACVI